MRSSEEFKAGILEKVEAKIANRRRNRKLIALVVTPCLCAVIAVAVLSLGNVDLSRTGESDAFLSNAEDYVDTDNESEPVNTDYSDQSYGSQDITASMADDLPDEMQAEEDLTEQLFTSTARPETDAGIDYSYSYPQTDAGGPQTDAGPSGTLSGLSLQGITADQQSSTGIISDSEELSDYLSLISVTDETRAELYTLLCDALRENLLVYSVLSDGNYYLLMDIGVDGYDITLCLKEVGELSQGSNASHVIAYLPRTEYQGQTIKVQIN